MLHNYYTYYNVSIIIIIIIIIIKGSHLCICANTVPPSAAALFSSVNM